MAQMKFSNRTGFPNIEAVSVVSDGTTTTISFNPCSYLGNDFYGGFWVKIPQAVTTSTEPVQFTTVGVSNSTVPVYLSSGTQATVADFVSTGPAIYLAFHDKDNNRVQLI